MCVGCALGKNANVAFLSSEHRPKGILDLIYSDVCGPILVTSMQGALYYVKFINSFSRKTCIYFIKAKDQ